MDGPDSDNIEDLYRALDEGTSDAGQMLVQIARACVDASEAGAAIAALRRLALSERSYRTWNSASRVLSRLKTGSSGKPSVRVALLGTSTLDLLGELIPLAGLAADLHIETYAAGYGQYEGEVLDPGSGLHAFEPDVILLAPDARAVALPPLADDPAAAVESELLRWTAMWPSVRQRSNARILQCNFAPPYARALGALDGVHPGARRAMFADLNRRLADAARRERIALVDVEAVATDYGLERWCDDRYWFHAKQAVALGALPRLATEMATVVRASLGRARKVLVTDLDNTLWGGVVGDEGVEGLQLSGSAVGEAHLALQQFLYELGQRGVLLAVSSKNEDATARSPFVERDDMVLSLDDFVAFAASWSPKDEAIRSIAEELDLGLDSFAFLDDNPAERAAVRQQLPEVDIIELPRDPSDYLRAMADYRGFDVLGVTEEDLARTRQYQARAAAIELREGAGSLEEFLESLDMVARIRALDDLTIQRVAQLVGKTNQWNLTTRRYSLGDLQRFVDDPDVVTFSLELTDRFAGHGIVAVAVAFVDGEGLEIDALLMSCRVINRTVERTLLDELIRSATSLDLKFIRGTYRRTGRNELVAETYRDLGFDLVDKDEEGSTWHLCLDTHDREDNQFIALDGTS